MMSVQNYSDSGPIRVGSDSDLTAAAVTFVSSVVFRLPFNWCDCYNQTLVADTLCGTLQVDIYYKLAGFESGCRYITSVIQRRRRRNNLTRRLLVNKCSPEILFSTPQTSGRIAINLWGQYITNSAEHVYRIQHANMHTVLVCFAILD